MAEPNHWCLILGDSDGDKDASAAPVSPRRKLLGCDTESFSDGTSTVNIDGVVEEVSEFEVSS